MNRYRNTIGSQNGKNNGSQNEESRTRVEKISENDKKTLLEQIRELNFVKTELELYLDTHPGCRVALDYYYRTVDALRMANSKYSALGSPLVAADVEGESWSWVSSPWPWDKYSDDKNGNGEK